MIDDVDEVLRQLLVQELSIQNGEVDITFDQPKREWSARLSRPTINLFLNDLHENKRLRQAQPMWEIEHHNNGTVTQRRKAIRVDLNYIITAWATEPEDEHRLLSRTLIALWRHPYLPLELLPESLQNQPVPIPITVGQEEEQRNPADFWGSMDNEWRLALSCVVTLAIDPSQVMTTPLIRTREIRIGQVARPPLLQLAASGEPDVYWTIGGKVRSDKPLEMMHLSLLERGIDIPLQPEGRFAIGNLRAGNYTLEVSIEGYQPQRYALTVPAADYDLEV